MPQTLVPTDSTASSVDAVAAVFGTLRDGDADARPATTTACPPRLSPDPPLFDGCCPVAGFK
jgi:hypothetical protein